MSLSRRSPSAETAPFANTSFPQASSFLAYVGEKYQDNAIPFSLRNKVVEQATFHDHPVARREERSPKPAWKSRQGAMSLGLETSLGSVHPSEHPMFLKREAF